MLRIPWMASAILASAIVSLDLGPAQAQGPICGSRQALLDRLADRYEEAPSHLGVTQRGGLVEILTSPTGSWTIIVTAPGGPTCMVSAGEGWREIKQVEQDPPV